MQKLIPITLLLLSTALLPSENPKELGQVRWERDFEAALKRSSESKKPVLALFQEVPG